MKTKKLICVLLFALTLTGCNKDDDDNTLSRESFPDLLFEKYILQNFDSDGDGLISIAEAKMVKDIDCSDMRITSIKGIQYFTELVSLNCSKNELKDFDISKNTSIRILNCSDCDFGESIDLSKNTSLEAVSCSNNFNITSLDFSNQTNLSELYCDGNYNLTSLNLNKNDKLERLSCNNNGSLKLLDLSNNTNLKELTCIGYDLMLKGLNNHHALETLFLKISEADTIGIKNSPLTTFYCEISDYSLIDVSECNKLETFKIEHIFNFNDQTPTINVDGCISLQSIDINRSKLNLLNISACTSLKTLRYGGEVDISKNTELEEVYVGDIINGIKNNSKLRILNCQEIKNTERIDLSYQTQLEDLTCKITIPIDFSKCKTLKKCYISDFIENNNQTNYIDQIDLNDLPLLESFTASISLNEITFNVKNCPMLKEFSTNSAAAVNISDCASIENIKCTHIKALDINQCANLIILECTNSPISTLSLDAFARLEELYCVNCRLKELDLRKNKELRALQCQYNPDLKNIYVTHYIPSKNIGNATLVYSEE